MSSLTSIPPLKATPLDAQLIEQVLAAQSGCLNALENLIEQTHQLVTSLAFAIVRDLDSAEDVAQQVYIVIWQKLGSLKNPSSFLPWLRQTTRHTASNYLRNNKVSRRIGGASAEQLFEQMADPENTENHYSRQQQSQQLNNFLDQQPSEARELILLYYREEQSSRQVAQLLGLSEACVRKKLSRLRQSMREELLQQYGQMILTSAPTVGSTSLIAAGIAAPAPAVAAVSAASQVSPWYLKALALLGGAALGGVLAIVAVFAGHRLQLRHVQDEPVRQQLLDNRNRLVGFILIAVLMLSASYELTQGWLWPILSYSVFIVGLMTLMERSNTLVRSQLSPEQLTRHSCTAHWAARSGMVIGGLSGFAGLLLGLINSGRLVW